MPTDAGVQFFGCRVHARDVCASLPAVPISVCTSRRPLLLRIFSMRQSCGKGYLVAMIRTVLEPMRPLIAANFSRHGPMSRLPGDPNPQPQLS